MGDAPGRAWDGEPAVTDTRTLASVGLNGFQRARLRLLLPEAVQRVKAAWTLGDIENADLLLLGEQSAEANAAGMLARGRGVRCIRMGDVLRPGEITLPAIFDVRDLARVLSSVEGPVEDFQSVDVTSPEFFEMADNDTVPMAEDHGIPEPVDLEHFLRRDSEEYSLERIVPYSLREDTVLQPVRQEQVSHRTEFRGSERDPYAQRVQSPPAQMVVREPQPSARPPQAGAESKPLIDYLRSGELMAPSQLVLPDAEPLILDPKHRVYMIVGDLASAEPYARQTYGDADFARLTTRELERWRELCEPMPYLRLEWLLALRGGDGWLPRHLDPGGSYHFKRMLDLDEHFDDQIRIGQVLANDWKRLHEVAASAGVEMQAVFNTVTAFDSIGWLEWRARERFR